MSLRAATVRGLVRSPSAGVFRTGQIRKYGLLNGTAGNYFSTPDSAAVSVTGDIDVRVNLAMTDWTPSGVQWIISKWGALQLSYAMLVTTTGALRCYFSRDGTTTDGPYDSTANVTFADATYGWIRFTRGSATGTVTFYTSTDGSTWSALGATVPSTAGALKDSPAIVTVGSQGDGGGGGFTMLNGRITRAQIYDGIGGTLKADFNPARYFGGATLKDGANTTVDWTIQGAAKILVQEL